MGIERFSVRFAETEEEKRAVYRLRYQDLLLDYRPELVNESKEDITEYDAYAKLVMCIDNESGEVVGSYRLITSDDLPKDKPFVAESEFSFDGLKKGGEGIVELSRAVVKKEYRNSVVLLLLLRFIAGYIRSQNYRYLIGTASFHGVDKRAFQQELSYLSWVASADDSLGITAKEENPVPILPLEGLNVAEIKRKIPPLIRAYVGFGAKVSKTLYTDRDFGSVDIFILLDVQNYNEEYLLRLLRM